MHYRSDESEVIRLDAQAEESTMTQAREALGIMDGHGQPVTTTFSQRSGFLVSKGMAVLLAAIFVCCIVATGFLVYNFMACPQNEHHAKDSRLHSDSTLCANVTSTTEPSPILNNANTVASTLPSKANVRLPRSIRPESYNVKLTPFIFDGNFTFHGEVKIKIIVYEDTDKIHLHASDLSIDEDNVKVSTYPGNILVPIVSQRNDTTRQFHIINLGELLSKGATYQVHIKFVGTLNDYLQGFYRSSYTVGNQTRWLAATQFQPTDARRAFPCFDEPALKASFEISIARPSNMSSISNMPRRGDPEPVKGLPTYLWDHYEKSVPMSTYLVAFVISDFDHITEGNFTVWARKEAIHSAAYSLEVGPKILTHFEKYFQIPFPLPKIDMIALPDFSAGAMENWGLITFRETAMLYEKGISANSNKQRVATVVAHELAHQWFGNLVTPSWWSDLWLNEGFASYVEYLGLDAVEPGWKSMDQFVVNEVQNVFSLDALSSSHQISVEVGNPEEINDIFDRISYGKGATIIRMMDNFLTTKVFKNALTTYLTNRKYQSAEQNDLWEALTSEARKMKIFDNSTSVKEIMDTWTLQTGFPVLTVTRNYDKNTASFSQKRFMLIKADSEKQPSSPALWWVPITYTTQSKQDFESTRPTHWMRRTHSLDIFDINLIPDQWLIVNIQQTGFYRVNYDLTNWKLISTYLNDPENYRKIVPSNRAQLIDDSLNLARAGLLDYETAMDVTKYLVHEQDYIPWKAAINALGFIDGMLVKGGDYDKYKAYFLQLLQPVYDEVGFNESPSDTMLTVYKRVDILTAACQLGLEDCVRQCVTQYHNWQMQPNPNRDNPISPDLKNVVYCTAIRVGGEREWDFAWERFQKAEVSSEKEILLSALGCSRETWILTRYLEWSITDDHSIRKQDVFRVFAAVSNNVIGQPLAFSFVRSNWSRMKDYLGSTLSNLNGILNYPTRRINTKFELDELKRFSGLHGKDMGRAIDQCIERAEANVAWMEANHEILVSWLNNVTS